MSDSVRPEDGRPATASLNSLSAQLISVSMALVGILSGIVTYSQANRVIGIPFWVAAGVTVLALFGSITCGAKGITKTAAKGAKGSWDPKQATDEYSRQALLGMVGLLALLATPILTEPKPPTNLIDILGLAREVGHLETRVMEFETELQLLADSLSGLSSDLMP